MKIGCPNPIFPPLSPFSCISLAGWTRNAADLSRGGLPRKGGLSQASRRFATKLKVCEGDGEVTHISERQHFFGILVPHASAWYGEGAMISVALHDSDIPRYQAAEMLSDLLGGYYAAKGGVPETQLRGMSGQHARKPAASGGYVSAGRGNESYYGYKR